MFNINLKENGFFKKFFKEDLPDYNNQTYFYNPTNPVWMGRSYEQFAREAYVKNVVANRCINIISQGAASVPWMLHEKTSSGNVPVTNHPILNLLEHPNQISAGAEFFENIFSYKLISGNAYILAISNENSPPKELHILRPDKVSVVLGNYHNIAGYKYSNGSQEIFYPFDAIKGKSMVLHLRNFNPLDDCYGLSPVEAASYSIDQHNQSAMWNQALLQNGARPSGALIVKSSSDGSGGTLSEEQFNKLRKQIDERYSSTKNAGRPLLLEGGLEWKEMSLSPKDMDFIEAKNSAARDIALAFGVPPQLLGIAGDNKYQNMQEARLALWEETILPLLDHMTDALNNWLIPMFDIRLKLSHDSDKISILSDRKEKTWQRLEKASFMTDNEKREAVGLASITQNNT